MKQLKIGIDARFFGSIGKGLGRYTQKLIENLEQIDGENIYYVFLKKENWDEYQPANPNFKKVLADIPWYTLREQIFLPRLLRKFNLDLIHFPHFNVPFFWSGSKFVVTIHDLILFHYPTVRASTLSPFLYLFKKLAHRLVIKRAISHAAKIIAVSEHTKKDIVERFRISGEKVALTYEAVDQKQNIPVGMDSNSILKKYGIIRPYLLYVGNAYPHKNLERLLLVFREVAKRHRHLHLVLVGKEDYFYRRLKKFATENQARNIIFADFVPDEELSVIYKDALLYVFPSLYEGFGLPPLEAMSRMVPVVSSNTSCLPEILGNAAHYFDPEGMAGMAEAIERAITDSELRKKLILDGANQIKKYSWKKMAEETLRIYKEV